MTKVCLRTALLLALILAATMLQAAPEVQALLDEFSAVDWDEGARPTMPDASDTAWLTRVRTEHALIGMGGAAVPDLVAALESENRHVRTLAAFCLGAIGDPAAVQPLIRRLSEDSYAPVRLQAAEALGRLADPAAAPALDATAARGGGWVVHMARYARQRVADRAAVGEALQAMARPAADFAGLDIPAVGEPAPDLELLDHTGEPVRLADYMMKKPVVVVFALANW